MAWPRPVKKPPSATPRPDERGATFYTTGMALPDERDGHPLGAHAAACAAIAAG